MLNAAVQLASPFSRAQLSAFIHSCLLTPLPPLPPSLLTPLPPLPSPSLPCPPPSYPPYPSPLLPPSLLSLPCPLPPYPFYPSPSPAPLPCIPLFTRSSSRCHHASARNPPPTPPGPPHHCWSFSLLFKLTLSSLPSLKLHLNLNYAVLVLRCVCVCRSKHEKVQMNAYFFWHGHTVCKFSGKSPFSSHKTTLKQQLNG